MSLSMGASRQREGKGHVTKVSTIKKVILITQGQIVLRSDTEIQRVTWRLNMGACRQREGKGYQTKVSAIKKVILITQEQIVLGSEESRKGRDTERERIWTYDSVNYSKQAKGGKGSPSLQDPEGHLNKQRVDCP